MNEKTQSPLRRLADIVTRTWVQIVEADVQLLASSLSFATVLSLVPLLAVSLSVFTAYGGLESLMKHVEPFILQNLVEASGAQLSRSIRLSIDRVHSGILGVTGAIALLLISTKLFHDMDRAFQRVWQLKRARRWYARLSAYWLIMFLAPLALALLLGLMGSKDLGPVSNVPKGVFASLLAFCTLASAYKFVPATPVRWRAAVISALLATCFLVLAQSFYAAMTKKFLSYNKVYGSLASVPIFLIWILLLWWICLAGVALTAVLQQQKGREV